MNSDIVKKVERIVELMGVIRGAELEIEEMLGHEVVVSAKPKSKKIKKPKVVNGRRERMSVEMRNAIKDAIRKGKKTSDIVKDFEVIVAQDVYVIKSEMKKKGELNDAVDQPRGNQSYEYECLCGYSFSSRIDPKTVRCPDCKSKPSLAEDNDGE